MSDSEYSVIKSDVIKSFDCINIGFSDITGLFDGVFIRLFLVT